MEGGYEQGSLRLLHEGKGMDDVPRPIDQLVDGGRLRSSIGQGPPHLLITTNMKRVHFYG